jgi:hypothetical protein
MSIVLISAASTASLRQRYNLTETALQVCHVCGDWTDTGNRCDDCHLETQERRACQVGKAATDAHDSPPTGTNSAQPHSNATLSAAALDAGAAPHTDAPDPAQTQTTVSRATITTI